MRDNPLFQKAISRVNSIGDFDSDEEALQALAKTVLSQSSSRDPEDAEEVTKWVEGFLKHIEERPGDLSMWRLGH